MARSFTGFLLLCFLGVILYFLFAQNQQPISLRLFGFFVTPSLPLGIWMLSFLGSGLFTSLLWQWFSYVPTSKSKAVPPSKKPSTPFQAQERTPVVSSSKSDSWQSSSLDDDWNLEEPPSTPTQVESQQPTPLVQRSPVEESPPPSTPSPSSEPQPSSRPPSTYSYSYRQGDKKQQENATDKVYDASYRVLTPPYQQPQAQQDNEDDEDWI